MSCCSCVGKNPDLWVGSSKFFGNVLGFWRVWNSVLRFERFQSSVLVDETRVRRSISKKFISTLEDSHSLSLILEFNWLGGQSIIMGVNWKQEIVFTWNHRSKTIPLVVCRVICQLRQKMAISVCCDPYIITDQDGIFAPHGFLKNNNISSHQIVG